MWRRLVDGRQKGWTWAGVERKGRKGRKKCGGGGILVMVERRGLKWLVGGEIG